MDTVLQTGSVAFIINAVVKIVSMIQAHSYASKRTDRTPENRLNLTKFTWMVTIASTTVTLISLYILEKHRVTSESYTALKGMHNTNNLFGETIFD